jgi:hypothetical protein
MSQDYEGWSVRTKLAVIALGVFVAALVALIVATGIVYNHRYAAQTRAIPEHFPAPVLETIDTAPSDTRQVQSPLPPAGIDAAMAATAAEGDALWGHP